MDSRRTLPAGESFIRMLTECMDRKQPVALLYDDHGLTRGGGMISRIAYDPPPGMIQLDNGLQVALSGIVAVNGVFLDSYSEC